MTKMSSFQLSFLDKQANYGDVRERLINPVSWNAWTHSVRFLEQVIDRNVS